MPRRLILVERAGHASAALRLFEQDQESTVLLALAPGVMQAFGDAGAAFKTPEDYLDPTALNQRGLKNYDLLEKLGQRLDARIQALPENLRLNPVYLHYLRLKILGDSVGLRTLELSAVLRAEKPDEVVALASPDDSLWKTTRDAQLMAVDGPIYAWLAPFIAKALGLEARVETVPGSVPQIPRMDLPRKLRAAAGDALKVLRALKPGAGKPVLWQVGELDHDVPDLLPPLERRFKVERWGNAAHGWAGRLLSRLLGPRTSREDRLALERFWSDLEKPLLEEPWLRYDGIDCFPLVRETLREIFVGRQLESGRLYAALRAFVRRSRPKAALTVNNPLFSNTLAVWALRAEGVPVVYAQEGGFYGYCHSANHHYSELSYGDHFLAYGRGPADYLNATKLTPRQSARAIAVGSLRLRRIRKSAPPSKEGPVRTVMYVVTDCNHNVTYAPLCYGERRYFTLRRRVVEALLAVPSLKIIYKAVPGALGRDALAPFLERHHDRVAITDAPLQRVLDQADAFVLDWPTTTLLELLTTPRPVWVLLDKDVTLPLESALPALRRRARAFLDLESFTAGLKGLASGDETLDDTAFLQDYGTGDPAHDAEAAVLGFFARIAGG